MYCIKPEGSQSISALRVYSSKHFFLSRNSHMEGLDLDSDLISDYTSALNDGRSWNSNRSGK